MQHLEQQATDKVQLAEQGMARAEAECAELQKQVESFAATDRALAWTFPIALGAGVGVAMLTGNALPFILGAVVAAGAHMTRVFSSGTPVSLYQKIGTFREEIHQLATQHEAALKERADLADTLKLLDGVTGSLAGKVGVKEGETCVTIGGVPLKKRYRLQ